MKKILRAFLPFAAEIAHNFMLLACILGPILMGAVFRFAIPALEVFICSHFNMAQILTVYYILFDLLLSIMTPTLFCFAGVLVILEELDCDVARYYSVTPIGKSGYLLSRLGIPMIISLVYDIALLGIFTVSKLSFGMIILLRTALRYGVQWRGSRGLIHMWTS